MPRILLADDNAQALRMGEQILRAQGFEVVSVTDGAVALRRLHDVDPDALIADIFLPTKSGFDLARFIRAQHGFKQLPVIFAAAPADKYDDQDAKSAGADAVLKKPFEASALLGTLQPLLERNKQTRNNGANGKADFDRNTIRAAVTIALDAAMPAMIEEVTDRVLMAIAARHG